MATRELRENLLTPVSGPDSREVGAYHAGVPDENPRGDVTQLLQAWTAGDESAREELMAAVYRERDWQTARAWLFAQLKGPAAGR